MTTFTGKQAIVTGAGSGIGASLCRALVAAGADVLCTDPAAVQAAVDDVVDRAGRLDLMFNNAGIVWGGDTERLTIDQWTVMTKHAIVGLSLALRSEAAAHEVGVLAVCPSAVETPLLDKGAIGGFDGRNYFLQGAGAKAAYPADRLAKDTLKAVEHNKALLVKPRSAHGQWLFARLAPGLMQRASIGFIKSQRSHQAEAHPKAR